jgi:hypothetical protein
MSGTNEKNSNNTNNLLLKVDEKNCYPGSDGTCIHVVHRKKVTNGQVSIEQELMSSVDIIKELGSDAPMHFLMIKN